MDKFDHYIRNNYKKIIGWGTSNYYDEVEPMLNLNIEYLIDSDINKFGSTKNGKTICSPEKLKDEDPDVTLIIVFSIFFNEIKEKIEEYGQFYFISGKQLLEIKNIFYQEKKEILGQYEIDKEIILSITRKNYSTTLNGLAKYLKEQNSILNNHGYINIQLFWREYNIKGFNSIMVIVVANGKEKGIFTIDELFSQIINLKAVIIHNLTGMDLGVLDVLLDFIGDKIPILYYLHDFSSVCKSIKLLYNNEIFCYAYEEQWNKCLTCTNNKDRIRIFNYHKKLFNKSNLRIIAPSKNTKEIICKSFDISNGKVSIVEHQKYDVLYKKDVHINKKIKIAYVGYKNIFKGWEIFKQVCSVYKDKYEFFCLGASDEFIEGVKYIDVSFIEEGQDAMTKKLIENSIDISLLWSLWPETYSYTYYESFAAGTFVITNELSGNIADQVRMNNNGIVLKDSEELIKLLSNENKLRNLLLKNDKIIENVRPNDEFLKFIQ